MSCGLILILFAGMNKAAGVRPSLSLHKNTTLNQDLLSYVLLLRKQKVIRLK